MSESNGYRRELGLFSATMLIAGSMIGSGIFLVPAETARMLHTGPLILLAWAAAGLLAVAGALSFAELAAAYPRAGGYYLYLREGFGPMVGFLCGWTSFLVIECGSLAAVGVGFGKYLGAFLPGITDDIWLLGPLRLPAWHPFPHASPDLTLGPYALGLTPARLAGILLILVFVQVNARGVRLGALVQDALSSAKLVALAGLVLLGLVMLPHGTATGVTAAWAAPSPLSPALPLLGAFLAAQVGCSFSGDGWQYATFISAEVKEPGRTLPRALLIGTALVFGLYLLANVAYLRVLGPAGMAGAPDDRVASTTLRLLLGPVGERVMAGAILLSMVGWMNGAVLAIPRVYQPMAEDGLFFKPAARLNRHGVPAISMGMMAVWASVLALTGTYGQLLDYIIFAALLFYALVAAAVVRLRFTRPGLERPYRVPIGIPVAYMLGAGSILGAMLRYRTSFSWPGLAIVLLGLPVYLWKRKGLVPAR